MGFPEPMSDLLTLIVGTLTLRPYVVVFLAVYLAAASRDLGLRRALAFTGWAWAVAFLAEFSSTRTGIPFGLYPYTGAPRGQELFLANVPFMDSLSFAFLAYAAFCLARLCLGRRRGAAVVVLSGLLMMLLDVVIDPGAVRGDRGRRGGWRPPSCCPPPFCSGSGRSRAEGPWRLVKLARAMCLPLRAAASPPQPWGEESEGWPSP